jgi:extracellular elastinolytic metalloproteinase
MTIKTNSIRNFTTWNWSKVITVSFIVMTFLVPMNVFGQLNLWDAPQGLPDLDNRAGQVAPTTQQLALVSSLGAKAEWNQFGTVHAMLKYGGFLATGLTGDPVSASREWIRANRALFRLSDQGVNSLELVSDGTMPYSSAHSVLFRQRFGNLVATQDGLINVAIVNGKVYHVWSSSAGDQAPPSAATITPVQAWITAAASINRFIPAGNILSANLDKQNNWTVLKIVGFPQDQQVRLTALPTPINGVRPAYEANVVYVQGHISDAYTIFVDAQTGEILYRVNRVNWFAPTGPQTQPIQGTYDPTVFPCATLRHHIIVPPGQTRIVVQVNAGVPTNDLSVSLLYGPDPSPALLTTEDTGTCCEALHYEPAGGVPPGEYQVQICQTPNTMGVPQMAPFNYLGTFTYDDTPIPSAGVPYPPQWKYVTANPLLDYSSTDVRRVGCWEAVVLGVPVPGCQVSEMNTASRAPWDYIFRSGTFTSTTRGNNAQTAESWGSPLTPSTPYAPTSATREYRFLWKNEWKTRTTTGPTTKGCDPTILAHTNPNTMDPGGSGNTDVDIDAAIVQLFVTHNRFHDWSYFLGFTEQNSNMQLDNLGNTQASRENDPEIGNVQAGAVSGGPNGQYLGRDNANQITLQDGTPGITNQYLFQPIAAALYSPCVDGDMDVGIVGHEYTHAISNRMVGGPDTGISGAQGGAMGESWSDLDAAEYLFANGFVPTSDEDPTAVGIYATQNKKVAIRNYSLAINPLNYGNVGYDTGGPEVHSDGEVWNGTNWEVRQALIDKYNAQYPYTDMALQKACALGQRDPSTCPGNRRWIQLMFDAFLLQPGATSMLDARDAMLAADVARFGGANQIEIWRAFAKRGMGGDAYTNGTGDNTPIPNFDSPVETNEATITFQAIASDESNAPITNAKIIVGRFQARSRQIADTDPATVVDNTNTTTRRQTLNRSDTAKFVPGMYDLMVQAPGYGIQRFTKNFVANQTSTEVFSLQTNRASMTKGATATTSAGVTPNNLIDDNEETGASIGTTAPVNGKVLTVDLAGTAAVMVTSVNISAAAGPGNTGRFNGLRKFEILTCNGTCALPTDFTVAFTSPDDAFPGDVPRPLQPNLNLRNFAITPTLATHVQLRVVSNQCTGQAKFAGDQDDDPFNNSDCPATASGAVVRASEFEVFSTTVCNQVNVAASAAGSVASASSSHGSGLYPAPAAINGDRTGFTWGTITGGWSDGTRTLYDDWLQVDFNAVKSINEIRVYTLQDGWQTNPGDPTANSTATGEGIIDFEVQTWSGSAWVTVPSGPVTGNTKAMRVFTFPDIATDKIRVLVHNARSFYSRIVEVEAYSCQ